MKSRSRAKASRIGAHLEENWPNSGTGAGTLSRMRKLIKEADPDVVEEWKWGNPVWSHDGMHLHWRILQECREAHPPQGRVVEG